MPATVRPFGFNLPNLGRLNMPLARLGFEGSRRGVGAYSPFVKTSSYASPTSMGDDRAPGRPQIHLPFPDKYFDLSRNYFA